MLLIDVKTDNITDYKETSVLLIFPYCSGKCGNACHNKYLQNLSENEYLHTTSKAIKQLYEGLSTHKAIVMAGLEPFDSFDDVLDIVKTICSSHKACDIVIYSGYKKDEYDETFKDKLLACYFDYNIYNNKKLIVKLGRYDEKHKNSWHSVILGVSLATDNQCVLCYTDKNSDTVLETINEGVKQYGKNNDDSKK